MSESIVEARRALGAVGAQIPSVGIQRLPGAAVQRDAARRIADAGYGAVWANEGVGGKDVFVQVAGLLAATEQVAFGTIVANIWARAPQVAHAASAQLAEAYPGRFVLGLGSGYAYQAAQVDREYKPLSAMRSYLATMHEPSPVDLPPEVTYARIVAANGPKMLDLAGRAADGALPTLVPPTFTAAARDSLGPDRLLVVGLTVVADTDRTRAKAAAQRVLAAALSFPASPYAANLMRLGYAEDDIRTAADPLLDEIVGYGSAGDVERLISAHLAAGADHVVMQPVAGDFTEQLRQIEQIAPS